MVSSAASPHRHVYPSRCSGSTVTHTPARSSDCAGLGKIRQGAGTGTAPTGARRRLGTVEFVGLGRDVYQRIEAAFATGDLDALRQEVGYLGDFPNVAPDATIGIPLVYAIYRSPMSLIRELLDAGADPNLSDGDGFPTGRQASPTRQLLTLPKMPGRHDSPPSSDSSLSNPRAARTNPNFAAEELVHVDARHRAR